MLSSQRRVVLSAGSQAPAWEPLFFKLQLAMAIEAELQGQRSQAGAWERVKLNGSGLPGFTASSTVSQAGQALFQ